MIHGTVRGREVETADPITFGVLEDMIRQGVAFGAIVRERAEAAS